MASPVFAQDFTNGTGNVNINNCVAGQTKVIYATKAQQDKIKELEAEVEELKELLTQKESFVAKTEDPVKRRKNSVSVLGGVNPTALKTTQTGSSYKAKTEYESDFGLMYQRDLSERFRATGQITIQGAGFLGIGYNF